MEVLHAIKHVAWPSSEELGQTTVNIGLIEGGQAANALAEASEAVAMFRLIGEPEEVLSAVKDIAAKHGCAVEVRGMGCGAVHGMSLHGVRTRVALVEPLGWGCVFCLCALASRVTEEKHFVARRRTTTKVFAFGA